ncbi:unnamed protein product [Cyclocybe aegerita]|uniref:DDE Tnp4 domain-containing protein n=1 Tax=Cyclocybe aegerita TaxID=1973307 RepID=A0A8S0WSG4_CYCAE|nr:unnamed protein product [Cyclocybe aegerita]
MPSSLDFKLNPSVYRIAMRIDNKSTTFAVMPTCTDRQEAADALHQAFLVNFLAELEAWKLRDELTYGDLSGDLDSDRSDIDMDSSSSSSLFSESSTSSSSEEEGTAARDYVDQMANLYSERYLQERRPITKTQENLRLLLDDHKINHPEIFRSYLRITPACFDDLVSAIEDDEVFSNNSQNDQMPVAEQVAIALYRFGHYGNAASCMKVALHFGVGYGTVQLVTTRVMKACCSECFRAASVQWASPQAKEAAKQWVEKASCPAWRDGWLMVDGTLVPLFCRPAFFGNVWFDRKSNYSMNVQLVSTPDCQIIDYAVGLPGSQHDASAWEETRTFQHHSQLLEDGEWVWADSAYPLQKWCQAPYKKPEKLTRDNTTHNYHVSAVRVRSEHCVGYLKGQWSSLRGLHVAINNSAGLQYATLWIIACIHLHAFAMKHEAGQDMSSDKFYRQGKKYQRKQQHLERCWRQERRNRNAEEENQLDQVNDIGLLEGKLKRVELKESILEYLGQ